MTDIKELSPADIIREGRDLLAAERAPDVGKAARAMQLLPRVLDALEEAEAEVKTLTHNLKQVGLAHQFEREKRIELTAKVEYLTTEIATQRTEREHEVLLRDGLIGANNELAADLVRVQEERDRLHSALAKANEATDEARRSCCVNLSELSAHDPDGRERTPREECLRAWPDDADHLFPTGGGK